MKTKLVLTSLVASLAILTGCTTVDRCPACGMTGHFNNHRNQTIRLEKRSFNYTKNDATARHDYTVPKIADTTDSWECENGHVIQVKY